MKPEKSVEKQVLAWARCNHWDVDVIDSKATYSLRLKAYRKSMSVPEGYSDICGNDSAGRAVYIELKAPSVKEVRVKQRAFLLRKIRTGCIAGVVRSVSELVALSMMNEEQMLEWLLSFKVSLK